MTALAARLVCIAENVTLPDGYVIRVYDDATFEVLCWRPDTFTGEHAWGKGGRRAVPESATTSQIVRAMFGAYLAYVEHEAREGFQYRGRRIFGPHIDVDALAAVADTVDFR